MPRNIRLLLNSSNVQLDFLLMADLYDARAGLHWSASVNAYEPESGDDEDSIADAPLLPARLDMAVKDKYSIAYLIFYLLGLGSLLPWNFFITASDYWMYKLRDVNATVPEGIVTVPTGYPDVWNTTVTVWKNSISTTPASASTATTLQSLFMNSLAICAMLPNVIFQFLNTLLQKRIPQNIRILTTLCLMIVLFIVTTVLVRVDTSTWQNTFFTATLISVVVINSCSAVFQSSVFGLAARFPQKYSGCIMAGQGMGGVFAALAMVIALAFSSNPTDSAFIFFLTAIAVLVLTMICYGLLTKLEFYKFYKSDTRRQASSNKTSFTTKNINSEEEKFLSPEVISCDARVKHEGLPRIASKSSLSDASNEESPRGSPLPLRQVVSKIWLHMFCVTFTFTITLTCFPAITAKIKSTASGTQWADTYYTPVCCFLLFNLGDWLGRTSASYIHIPASTSKWTLLISVLARSVFPFLFAFCNYQPRSHLPVAFHHDGLFIFFMVLFALSNGHLSTLCMQYGPKQVEQENQTTAGSMLAFMISVGLLAGAGLSFLVCSLI